MYRWIHLSTQIYIPSNDNVPSVQAILGSPCSGGIHWQEARCAEARHSAPEPQAFSQALVHRPAAQRSSSPHSVSSLHSPSDKIFYRSISRYPLVKVLFSNDEKILLIEKLLERKRVLKLGLRHLMIWKCIYNFIVNSFF